MLTQTMVKNAIKNLQGGQILKTDDIMWYIGEVFKDQLTAEDMEQYTDTKETNYPRWKSTVNWALNSMKADGTIKHNADTHEYEIL